MRQELWAAVSAAYSALLSSSYFERINDDEEITGFWDALASAGPYANNIMHLTPGR